MAFSFNNSNIHKTFWAPHLEHIFGKDINSTYVVGPDGEYSLSVQAPGVGGKYYLSSDFVYHTEDGIGSVNVGSIRVLINVTDIIVVTTPVAEYDPYNKSLIISGIHATCTNLSHGKITPANTITHEIHIINSAGEGIFFTDLLWTGTDWQVKINDTADWELGNYYVKVSFWDGMHLGESVHVENDTSEFTITNVTKQPVNDDNGDGKDAESYMRVAFFILIIFVLSFTVIVFYFHKHKNDLKDSDNITEYSKDAVDDHEVNKPEK
jgi:hypothetical protein